MKLGQVKNVLDVCFESNEQLKIQGNHGIGKSTFIEEWAEENNIFCKVLFLSHMEVGDLIGIPVTTEDSNGKEMTVWSKPSWFVEIEEQAAKGKHTMLFLDELNRAQKDVLDSALALVLDGRLHEHTLPKTNGKRTMIVSAVNPSEHYQVNELDDALEDRFLNIDVEEDVDAWLKWSRKNKVNEMVRSFIRDNSDKLFYRNVENSNEKTATPRSWTKLAALLTKTPDLNEEWVYPMITGKIGKSLGMHFYQYALNYSKIISIDNIYEKVEEVKDSTIEEIAEHINEELQLEEQESVFMVEMAKQLWSKDMNEVATADDVLALRAFLYAMKREHLISVLQTFKQEDFELYNAFAKIEEQENDFKLFIMTKGN